MKPFTKMHYKFRRNTSGKVIHETLVLILMAYFQVEIHIHLWI